MKQEKAKNEKASHQRTPNSDLLSVIFPFPIRDFWHIETNFVDVLFMFDKLVGHLLI